MVNKYKYNGEIEVVVPDLAGTIKPGEVFDTTFTLNHPDFELISPNDEVSVDSGVTEEEAKETGSEESVVPAEAQNDTSDTPVEGEPEGE